MIRSIILVTFIFFQSAAMAGDTRVTLKNYNDNPVPSNQGSPETKFEVIVDSAGNILSGREVSYNVFQYVYSDYYRTFSQSNCGVFDTHVGLFPSSRRNLKYFFKKNAFNAPKVGDVIEVYRDGCNSFSYQVKYVITKIEEATKASEYVDTKIEKITKDQLIDEIKNNFKGWEEEIVPQTGTSWDRSITYWNDYKYIGNNCHVTLRVVIKDSDHYSPGIYVGVYHNGRNVIFGSDLRFGDDLSFARYTFSEEPLTIGYEWDGFKERTLNFRFYKNADGRMGVGVFSAWDSPEYDQLKKGLEFKACSP